MRIKMLQTIPGSLDGRTVTDYLQGAEYELPDQGAAGLLAVFLREGWAREVSVEPVPEVTSPAEVGVAPAPVRRRGRK